MITDEAWWWALIREMWARFYINTKGVGCRRNHLRSGREAMAADGYLFHFVSGSKFMALFYICGLACKCKALPFPWDSITRLRLLLNRSEACNGFNGTFKCFLRRLICKWTSVHIIFPPQTRRYFHLPDLKERNDIFLPLWSVIVKWQKVNNENLFWCRESEWGQIDLFIVRRQ